MVSFESKEALLNRHRCCRLQRRKKGKCVHKLLVGTSGSPNCSILFMCAKQKATNQAIFCFMIGQSKWICFSLQHGTRGLRERSKVSIFLSLKLHRSIAHYNVSRTTLTDNKRNKIVYPSRFIYPLHLILYTLINLRIIRRLLYCRKGDKRKYLEERKAFPSFQSTLYYQLKVFLVHCREKQ